MKTFKFRMQSVLEQRQRQETLAMQDFAVAEAACQRGQKLMCELVEVRTAILEELTQQRQTDFDPMESRIYYEYLQTITQSIKDQEIYLRELLSTREALKMQMIGAARNHKAIATVKDRDRTAHSVQVERVAQNALDEMATSRYVHQQRAQG